MVRGPWVDLYSQIYTLQYKGGQPFMTHDTLVLRDHKMRRIYTLLQNLTQNMGF